MLSITQQKYIIISTVFGLNVLLCVTFGIYTQYWYAFLFALGLCTYLNSVSVGLILGNSLFAHSLPEITSVSHPRNVLYLVPCYNETLEELQNTLNSLTGQYLPYNWNKSIVIVCDGRVQGTGSDTGTDIILKNILNIDSVGRLDTYNNAAGNIVNIEIHNGTYRDVQFMLIIKNENQGKRDSITLIRKLALGTTDSLHGSLTSSMIHKYDFIVGVDADTVFHPMCSYELIKKIEYEGENCKGCVGLVDIPRKWNIFVMYQYAEYHFGQFLRRRVQSEITGKVNCLSGCNQIIRVCEETCGDALMNRFNRLPDANENILSHIRAYASEDRNHVCLMLSMYPYVRTVQNTQAIAYTGVPESVKVFLSQRRRWTLGAISNDVLLTYLPGINFFERCSAVVNIVTFLFNTFIAVATGFFIHAIVTSRNMLMLYLSIPMIVPFVYSLLFIPNSRGFNVRETIYFLLSYMVYILCGVPVSIIVHTYSLLGMDTFKWGKTRQTSKISNPIVFYLDDDPADIELTGSRETFV